MILCGTDFTGAAHEAARAAAAIAARGRVPLELVHVLDFPTTPDDRDEQGKLSKRWHELFRPEMERRQTLLENEADRLTELGVEVRTKVLSGTPDETLLARAMETDATLIVVASLGHRSPSSWRLGSVADRLALTSNVPVLIARSARPFETWSDGSDGGQPLRILFGVDLGRTSEAAAEWVGELKTLGPCELMAAHVYEPEQEARRLGLAAPLGSSAGRERIVDALADMWSARLADRTGEARLCLRASTAGAGVADQLIDLAEEERADLIVVGTHQRKGFSRHWRQSVSYSVLPLAATNVVVVPSTFADRGAAEVERPKRVLAVTDLTELGNRAVGQAYAVVPRGGCVTLMHVALSAVPIATPYGGYVPVHEPGPEQRAAEERELEAGLTALVPRAASASGVETRVEIVRSADVVEAVCQTVERESIDLVCMATHAHGTVASALLGSAAQGVVRRCGRPVLLVGPGRD